MPNRTRRVPRGCRVWPPGPHLCPNLRRRGRPFPPPGWVEPRPTRIHPLFICIVGLVRLSCTCGAQGLFVHRHRRERCVVKCAESVWGRASTGVHVGLGLLSARRCGRTLGTLSDACPGISNHARRVPRGRRLWTPRPYLCSNLGRRGRLFSSPGWVEPRLTRIYPLFICTDGLVRVYCTCVAQGARIHLQWHERHVVKSEEWATTLRGLYATHALLIARIVDWPTNSTPFPTSLGDCSSLSGHT